MNLRDTMRCAALIDAAQRGATVARLVQETNDVQYGTARSVGDQNGNFARDTDDVRDLYLRVTLHSGFEAFLPMRELMTEYAKGYFVIDPV